MDIFQNWGNVDFGDAGDGGDSSSAFDVNDLLGTLNDYGNDDNEEEEEQGGGGFFSNLFSGNFGQNAQGGINNWLGGLKPPTINTENSIDKQSIMMIGAVALVLIFVMKKK